MSGNSGAKVIRDGLVLYLDSLNVKSWGEDLDTAIFGTWKDMSDEIKNNSFGTTAFPPNTLDPPDTGIGLFFDGILDYFLENDSTSVSEDSQTNIFGDVTVETWFKAYNLTGTYSKIFGKGLNPRQYGLWIRQDQFLYQRIGGGITMNCPYNTTPNTLEWYHMTGTSKGTNEHFLYLNGIQVGSSTTAVTAVTTTDAYRIAQHNSTNYFNGIIANVKLYNRALSAEEVLQNFNAHRGRFRI
jgi:hypothetical protein